LGEGPGVWPRGCHQCHPFFTIASARPAQRLPDLGVGDLGVGEGRLCHKEVIRVITPGGTAAVATQEQIDNGHFYADFDEYRRANPGAVA
jgi:hypothetical protein